MGLFDEFKKGFAVGKLKAIQEDARKRCGSCDHYISGTKMCKKHNKKIERPTGADGEFCEKWSDLKQAMKQNLRQNM